MYYNPSLNCAAYHQMTVKTAIVYRRVKHLGIKPRGFITVFPPLNSMAVRKRIQRATPQEQAEYSKIVSALYTPFTRNIDAISEWYVIKTGENVSHIKPLTVQESIANYATHEEKKALNGHSTGEMLMRRVLIVGRVSQGKESSYDMLDVLESDLPEELSTDEIDMLYPDISEWRKLQTKIRHVGVSKVAHIVGISQPSMTRILKRTVPPEKETLEKIQNALSFQV